MAKNTHRTSARVATIAAETLHNPNASQTARTLAASALAQREKSKQTGAEVEALAGRVLQGDHYAEETKILAASVISQANKER